MKCLVDKRWAGSEVAGKFWGIAEWYWDSLGSMLMFIWIEPTSKNVRRLFVWWVLADRDKSTLDGTIEISVGGEVLGLESVKKIG